VARLAGLPAPPAVSREEARSSLPRATWSYLADSRRVDTTRMREELGVKIRYADLEDGIRASLSGDSLPNSCHAPPTPGCTRAGERIR
jgi:nucleoside-diphosphate-sugar epimerase